MRLETETTGRVTPFSNGNEYDVWTTQNCEMCTKGFDWDKLRSRGCPIEEALSLASMLDGTISADIAKRGGFDRPHDRRRDCPEFEPIRPGSPEVAAIRPLPGQLSLFGD